MTAVKTHSTQKHKVEAATTGIREDFHLEKDSSSNFTSTEHSSKLQQSLGLNSSFCHCTMETAKTKFTLGLIIIIYCIYYHIL